MENQLIPLSLCGGVLIVASINKTIGDWTAYIGVSGAGNIGYMNLELTTENVARHGDKIAEKRAAALFPEAASAYHWRS